jgi:preprotein translocase subunit SecY
MANITHKIKLLFTDKSLRKRILFVLGAFIVIRLFSAIPIPGVDANQLASFLANNQFFGLLNVFSGGGLSTLSIVMLGVGPYITASIIMQLMTLMVPSLKEMNQEGGEAGRKKFAQYTRILSIPLALIQGFSLLTVLAGQGVIVDASLYVKIINLVIITAGSMLMVWIGELISEFGIGNGVSLIIFAGIVAALPSSVSQFAFTYSAADLPLYILFLVMGLLVVAGVVMITEAERPIGVTYSRQVRGMSASSGVTTYIPLRLNMAGVIPIIFALSIMLFPQIFANLFANSSHAWLANLAGTLAKFTDTTVLYAVVYFVLVFVFTYFYTSVTFDPKQMADNLQKNGAFVPGIRPGESTTGFISNIVTRITLVGGLFLGIIAVLPLIVRNVSGITSITLGGTALLIVVSVVIDLLKKIDAQTSMREY